MTVVECWQGGKLVTTHRCPSWGGARILKHFGLNHCWTVCIYPEGRPDLVVTLQTEAKGFR